MVLTAVEQNCLRNQVSPTAKAVYKNKNRQDTEISKCGDHHQPEVPARLTELKVVIKKRLVAKKLYPSAGRQTGCKVYAQLLKFFVCVVSVCVLLTVNGLPDYELGAISNTKGFTLTSGGFDVSGAGDFNGDGVDDIIIGVFWPNGNTGITYVVFGRNDGTNANMDLASFSTGQTTGFRIFGAAPSDVSGFSVSKAGDINNDGIDDVIMGARIADASVSKTDSGVAYVFFGRKVTSPANAFVDLQLTLNPLPSNIGFRILGAEAGDFLGFSVSSAGDMNGDGLDDIILSAAEADAPGGRIDSGITYVIFGRNTTDGVQSFGDLDLSFMGPSSTIGFRIFGAAAYDLSGYAVSLAGDVNGDGVSDIIIGAFRADISEADTKEGCSYVIFGRKVLAGVNDFTDIQLPKSPMDPSVGFRILGAAEADHSGVTVSGAGDVNDDGIDDVILGAYLADPYGRISAGIVYVVFGRRLAEVGVVPFGDVQLTAGSTDMPGNIGFRIVGASTGDLLGVAVAAAGDVNGDGVDDVIVGASDADPAVGREEAGISYVIYGRKSVAGAIVFQDLDLALPLSPAGFRLLGFASMDYSGRTAGGVGDVNSDGGMDVIIGTTFGPSYVIYGTPPSPTSQPSRQPSNQPSSQPSRQPSVQPSNQPTRQPTSQPSSRPSSQPSAQPSRQPSTQPSGTPTKQPAAQPSAQPSIEPSARPTNQPSRQPSCQPSSQPSSHPTSRPSTQPTLQPSRQPTQWPTSQPSRQPSVTPSSQPVAQPTIQPSTQPSQQPSKQPTSRPSMVPSRQPNAQPSLQPSTLPSAQPSAQPSMQPSSQPTKIPSSQPSIGPTSQPSNRPSMQPSTQPTCQPSHQHSNAPSSQPSAQPSCEPSSQPSVQPSCIPSTQPFSYPSAQPSELPTSQQTSLPSTKPTSEPSTQPTQLPTSQPSVVPTVQPTTQPSHSPSSQPTSQPATSPTNQPSSQPSLQPSRQPTLQPTMPPSAVPSGQPSMQPTAQPSASIGSWVKPFRGVQTVSGVIGTDVWACSSANVNSICSILETTTGISTNNFTLPWTETKAIETTSQSNQVVVSGKIITPPNGVQSEIAKCDMHVAQLLCKVLSFRDTDFTRTACVPFPQKLVNIGTHAVFPVISMLDMATSNIQSFLYVFQSIQSVALLHAQSPPNYVGAFLAGEGQSFTGLVNYIVAGTVRTDSGALKAMYLTPTSGIILNNAELVNAMALEHVHPDMFIAGGLELSDGTGMHAYILRVNALFNTVRYCTRYRASSGDSINSGGSTRRSLSESVMYSSVTKEMALVNTAMYMLTDLKGLPPLNTTSNIDSAFSTSSIVMVDIATGSILQQVHISATNASLSCTDIWVVTPTHLSIVCQKSLNDGLVQSYIIASDLQMTFSKLPAGFSKHTHPWFTSENTITFKAGSLPVTAQSTQIRTTEYIYSTAEGAPTLRPSGISSYRPSEQPSSAPSGRPSSSPTSAPSVSPQPTSQPSSSGPTNTYKPTVKPTPGPSIIPSQMPSPAPTRQPTNLPTARPTVHPTRHPSISPSTKPTDIPTRTPTTKRTLRPTLIPFILPTHEPSAVGSIVNQVSTSGTTGNNSSNAVFILLYVLGGLVGLWSLNRMLQCYQHSQQNYQKRKLLRVELDTVKASLVEQPPHSAHVLAPRVPRTTVSSKVSKAPKGAYAVGVDGVSGFPTSVGSDQSSSVVVSSLHSSEMSDISYSVYSEEPHSLGYSDFSLRSQSDENNMEEGDSSQSGGSAFASGSIGDCHEVSIQSSQSNNIDDSVANSDISTEHSALTNAASV